MKITLGTTRIVALVVLVIAGTVGMLGSVARAAAPINVPRIPRSEQEESAYSKERTSATRTAGDFSLLARGRSEDRESPTIPDGPFTF